MSKPSITTKRSAFGWSVNVNGVPWGTFTSKARAEGVASEARQAPDADHARAAIDNTLRRANRARR